jgi:hypothetical protein
MSTQTDTQVTTVVQQIDAQGPAVIDRISTQFADVACTSENAKEIVEALHSGTSVTLNADGKTATFTPTTKLGYGEAYIAMALAAEALRNAGVSGCATPDQWKSVLLGGPLAAAGTTTTTTSRGASATSSSSFPGILALRSQGQGWGQIAQTTNVKLGQVMSSAKSSLNLGTSSDTSLSPTGRSSSSIDKSSSSTSPSSTSTSTDYSTSSGGKDKDKDKNKDKDESTSKPDDRSTDLTTPSSSSSSTSPSSSSTSPSSSSSSSSTSPRSNR